MGGINACYLQILFQNSCRIIAPNGFHRKFQSVSAKTLSQEEKLKNQALPVWGQFSQARASLVIFDRVTYLFQGPKQNNAYKKQTHVRSIWIRTEEGKKIHNYVDDFFFFNVFFRNFPLLKEFELTDSCNSILELLRDCQYRCRHLVLRGLPRFLDHVSLWVF